MWRIKKFEGEYDESEDGFIHVCFIVICFALTACGSDTPNNQADANQHENTTGLRELIVANQIPDIMIGSKGSIDNHIDLDIFEDISPLVKKYNFDLAGIQPVLLDMIKNRSGGELIGLPMQASTYSPALYYNKDLFDKFNVSYPTDRMTSTHWLRS